MCHLDSGSLSPPGRGLGRVDIRQVILVEDGPSRLPRRAAVVRRHAISDNEWALSQGVLPTRGRRAKNRLFVDAVLWMAKTGAPWRDLPERFGPWNSAFRRFSRWSKSGV